MIVGAVYIVLMIVVMFMLKGTAEDKQRDGHESVNWAQRFGSQRKKVKFMTYSLTIGTFLFLPISQAALEVLTCAGLTSRYIAAKFPEACSITSQEGVAVLDCDCGAAGGAYSFLVGMSVLCLITYTITFPIFMFVAIWRNKPRGSLENADQRYDEDGLLVAYTDAMYRADLATPEQKANPFLSLYKAYERKYAWYRVFSLLMQLLITITVVALYGKPVEQSVAGIVILACWSGMALMASPFLSPVADFSETVGRISSTATLIFTLIGNETGGDGVMGALINITQAVALTLMVTCVISDLPPVRRMLRSITNTLYFEDSCGDTTGKYFKIWPAWSGSLRNLRREVKHSIWHAFWQGLMMHEDTPKAIQERFLTNVGHTQDAGKEQIQKHWQLLGEDHIDIRQALQEEFEGVDVYWKDRFGKMWVRPYPFTCYHVSDSGDVTPARVEEAPAFLDKQRESEVAEARQLRKHLRALNGRECKLGITRQETHSIPDGYETHTDSNGNTSTTRRYATVTIDVTYDSGTGHVRNSKGGVDPQARESVFAGTRQEPEDDGEGTSRRPSAEVEPAPPAGDEKEYRVNRAEFAYGFTFHVSSTGHGVGFGPRTGERTEVHPTHDFGTSELGIEGPGQGLWKVTDASRFMDKNMSTAKAHVGAVEAHHQEYRAWQRDVRVRAQATLTSAFWYFIFDNDNADWDFVCWYFDNMEVNEAVQQMRQKHGEGIALMLYRLKYARTSPASAFWYQVFSDTWEMNNELRRVKEAEELLNPKSPKALCYRPMERGDLEAILEEHRLGRNGRGLFNGKMLDQLYETLEQLSAAHAADNGEAWRHECSQETSNHHGLDLDKLSSLRGRI